MLCSKDVFQEMDQNPTDLCFEYIGIKKRLHNVIDLLEKSSNKQRTVIYSPDIQALWQDFKSIHQFRKAAGGIVFNEFGQLLVIFRKGLWDLPKGHIDKNERKKETAMREVEEECGIKLLKIQKKVGKTYHIYRIKGRKVLKKSTWFYMTTQKQLTIPQRSEDIEQAIWVYPETFMNDYDMYPSIRAILLKFNEKMATV